MELKTAIKDYLKYRKFKVRNLNTSHLRNFYTSFLNRHIDDIELNEILDYMQALQDLGLSRNGLIPVIISLRKLFEFWSLRGLEVLNHELIPIPSKTRNLANVCNERERETLLENIPKDSADPRHFRNKAIISLLWDTGARNSEICSIDICNMDKNSAIIRTKKAVNKPHRRIFWTSQTSFIVEQWIEKRQNIKNIKDKEALFLSCVGQKSGQRLTNKGLGEMLRRLSRKSGFEKTINAHSFRHRFGKSLAKKKANNSVISSLMGHSNLQSSYVYTELYGKDLKGEYHKYFS